MRLMKRFRSLAAVLGCLAVLAGGFMTVAAAMPSGASAPERNTASAPCSHCDECDGVPCPMPAATCLQALSNATPTLTIGTIDLPAIGFSKICWSLRTTALSGLSPPPDPFPPRA
jgi:hypothetical protein